MRKSLLPHLMALVLTSGMGVACGEIEVPTNLAVLPGSSISLTLPLPPPNDIAETTLVGGIEARAIIDLGLGSLLDPNGIVAVLEVDDILIAGEEIVFLGLIPTGTICVEPGQDPPGSGLAYLQPLRHRGIISMDLFTQIRVTDPTTAGVLGGTPLPFDVMIDATVPLTLSDLIDLFLGTGGLVIDQQLVSTLPPDLPIIGGSTVTADVTLASVDEIPVDPLLLDCVAP